LLAGEAGKALQQLSQFGVFQGFRQFFEAFLKQRLDRNLKGFRQFLQFLAPGSGFVALPAGDQRLMNAELGCQVGLAIVLFLAQFAVRISSCLKT